MGLISKLITILAIIFAILMLWIAVLNIIKAERLIIQRDYYKNQTLNMCGLINLQQDALNSYSDSFTGIKPLNCTELTSI